MSAPDRAYEQRCAEYEAAMRAHEAGKAAIEARYPDVVAHRRAIEAPEGQKEAAAGYHRNKNATGPHYFKLGPDGRLHAVEGMTLPPLVRPQPIELSDDDEESWDDPPPTKEESPAPTHPHARISSMNSTQPPSPPSPPRPPTPNPSHHCLVCEVAWKVGDRVVILGPCHDLSHIVCWDRWVVSLNLSEDDNHRVENVLCPFCGDLVTSQHYTAVAELAHDGDEDEDEDDEVQHPPLG